MIFLVPTLQNFAKMRYLASKFWQNLQNIQKLQQASASFEPALQSVIGHVHSTLDHLANLQLYHIWKYIYTIFQCHISILYSWIDGVTTMYYEKVHCDMGHSYRSLVCLFLTGSRPYTVHGSKPASKTLAILI